MIEPIFTLAYTSVREKMIGPVVESWLKTAFGNYPIEVVIAVDGNRPDCIEAAKNVEGAVVVVQDQEPFNSTRGWNAAGAASRGKVIICIADDFKPCEGWDEKLFTLKPGWVDEDWVAHTEDGYVHNLCVLSILTRKRYDRFGYVFYPEYPSLFSDTEFTEVAYLEGRVLDAKHIIIEHMHPDCFKRDRDNFDNQHASQARWKTGEMLFEYRKNIGFPVDAGPKAHIPSTVEPPKQNGPYEKFAAYLQANRNDLCLDEVCQRLYEEGIRNFFFCIPDEYWSGKPTSQTDIQQVKEVASRLSNLGANVKTKQFTVSEYRFSGDNRITVETRVRNDSLSWVRQNGFNNICVVDSDELWQKGTLAIIAELVKSCQPLAISLPMIPVLGFPGYPVLGATDRVISYVGHACVFRDCRTPIGQVYYENRTTVYHFTSTRRTMEETIEKHRQSGHFDDPEYDFENWIKNVLPNVKPGLKNAHMYKRYQIWPQVRAWTPDDLVHIPTSIHQYLAVPANA